VVAVIFTILIMLMPNVTNINLFRPQSCKKFCWLNPPLIWHPTDISGVSVSRRVDVLYIIELAGLGLLSISS